MSESSQAYLEAGRRPPFLAPVACFSEHMDSVVRPYHLTADQKVSETVYENGRGGGPLRLLSTVRHEVHYLNKNKLDKKESKKVIRNTGLTRCRGAVFERQ